MQSQDVTGQHLSSWSAVHVRVERGSVGNKDRANGVGVRQRLPELCGYHGWVLLGFSMDDDSILATGVFHVGRSCAQIGDRPTASACFAYPDALLSWPPRCCAHHYGVSSC